MSPEANASKRDDHDPAAMGALREAAEIVGLDVNRVLVDGARLELGTDRPGRAVLTVSILLTRAETAMVIGRVPS